jgi:hypothetical protein
VRKWKEFANLFNIFYRENNTFFHFYRKINAFSLPLTEGANPRLERKREEIERGLEGISFTFDSLLFRF